MAKKLTQNVNKDKFLNDLPKVNPPFSKWLNRFCNYQSCDIGDIVPIYVDEVLPNERRKVTMAMCSHTTTPIAPIFPSMYTEIRSFVIPIRLCADLFDGYASRKSPWNRVFGEDINSTTSVIVPLANQKLPSFIGSSNFIGNIYTYLTDSNYKANNVFDSLDLAIDTSGSASAVKSELAEFNFLTLAAYELVYQRHYRNENYEPSTSSVLYRLCHGVYGSGGVSLSLGSFTFHKAQREKDYFTGMKPFTQKGDPVTLSVSDDLVPVTGFAYGTDGKMDKNTRTIDAVKLPYQATNTAGDIRVESGSTGYKDFMLINNGSVVVSGSSSPNIVPASNTQLAIDLRSVTGISVEELRLLIKTQELLEKDAMYGSRYAESLNAHFGCCPLDLTLQDPQEIYSTTITSNMQAIFQTSSTSGEASILGTIGANSTTQTDNFVIVPETHFKEHCILMVCAVHKLQNVYDSKYFKPKFNFKNSRFDFYTPELNDLGFQPVTDREMRSSGASVAGFNEAFAEYRYKFNKVHGELSSQFPYWAPAISNEYSSANALRLEDPIILDKALSYKSTTTPQFYDAWGFEEENTKPMSLHSIPGFDGVI